MEFSFRWYGPEDPVTLAHIRQIPGVTGIVTALYDVPVGTEWPLAQMRQRKAEIEEAGLRWTVIESIPVHEDVKLGRAGRDAYIEAFGQSIRHMGRVGIPVLCYNFMPIFDWTRTDLAMPLPDGSTALAYTHQDLARIDLSRGTDGLPGWGATYNATALADLRGGYAALDQEALWDNLGYFLERVVPVAAAAGVKMALHPDDPPWPIFDLPRIITDGTDLERLLSLVDHPNNGLTFCTGSLGPNPANDLPALVRKYGDRIHFVHLRNILRTGPQDFHEVAHPSAYGSVDLPAVMAALLDVGFDGPLRPDHGRMIWGEKGRPGYGLYDRALGATYLLGLYEAGRRRS